MALFDDQWFTGLQTALTSIATAAGGFVGGWALMRRRLSSDSTEITKDRVESRWMLSLEAAASTAREDSRTIAKLEARLEDALEREKATKEHDIRREQMVGACEERVRSLSEQLLDQKMVNGRLFMALTHADKDAAERLLQEHLRPAMQDSHKGPQAV